MVQGRQKMKSYKVPKQIRVPKEEWFIVENTNEPIIDQEAFDKAQQLLLRDTRIAPTTREVHLFSGFVRCADCGRTLNRRTSSKNTYYFCRQYYAAGTCKSCSIREDILINAVLVSIQKQIDLVINLTNTLDEIKNLSKINVQVERLSTMLSKKQIELKETISISDNLYVDWKNGDISQDEYKRLKADFSNKAKHIKDSIDEISKERAKISDDTTVDNLYFSKFIKYRNIKELTREVIIELIDIITIDENKNVTVKFNFTDQYQSIIEFIENNKETLKTKV